MMISIFTTGIMVWSYHPILLLPLLFLFILRGISLKIENERVKMETELTRYRRKAKIYQNYLTKPEYAKEIKLMSCHIIFTKKWHEYMENGRQKQEKIFSMLTRWHILLDILEQFIILLSYGICVFFAFQNIINIAQFGSIIVLLQQFINNAQLFMQRVQNVYSESVDLEESLKYFDLKEEPRPSLLKKPIHTITMNHITYRYPEMNVNAVEDVSLNLQENETIALVGENGSGKTTLSKLISGLISPTEGEVFYDDIPTRTVDFASLYHSTTAVFQDFTHYYTTVEENIHLGDTRRKMSEEEMNTYLHDIGITFPFEKNIPLTAPLGIEFGGIELSGGQWQQLAIARGNYKTASLVVLDEVTSALDPIKEAQLYDTFRRMCEGKIGILITHRMSLCSLANRICVMKNGHIVECGTHRELMKIKGEYYDMFSKQANLYQH